MKIHTKKNRVPAYLRSSSGITAVLLVGLSVSSCYQADQPKAGATRIDPILALVEAQASGLQPDKELSEMFALGSKNTDLQREMKLKEIQGKIVLWTLPVYEVSRADEGYKVQTRSRSQSGLFGEALVGTMILITPRSDDDRRLIERLKTDDLITFKGRISGTFLRNIDINPAIIATRAIPEQKLTQQRVPETLPTTLYTLGGAVTAEEAAACTESGKCAHVFQLRNGDVDFRQAFDVAFSGTGRSAPTWFSDGLSTPVYPVEIASGAYLLGSSCKPHDCADNQISFLYSIKSMRFVGKFQQDGHPLKWLGNPTPDEQRVLRDFDNEKSSLRRELNVSKLPIVEIDPGLWDSR